MPPCATSSPVTDLAPALIVGLGPSSSYCPPCSASGFQSVCSTIVDGQPAAFRLSAAGTAAVPLEVDVLLTLLLLLLAHAVAVSASAAPTVAAAASLVLCRGIKWSSSMVKAVGGPVFGVLGGPAALPVSKRGVWKTGARKRSTAFGLVPAAHHA